MKPNQSRSCFRAPTLTATLFAASLLLTTAASANDAPQLLINGADQGKIMFDGPVQFTGQTGDQDGIREIYGTIQNMDNQMFFSPQGKFVKDPTRLPFKFAKNAKRTRWTTNAYNLPAGNYVYRMRVEDGKSLIGDIVEVPVQVVARRAIAIAKPETRQAQAATQQPAAQQPAAKVVAGKMAANGMPYCANASADADGDGFGWQSQNSCVVAGSRADKHPNCASASSDPDGDGYGWENEKSCIVVTHCSTAAADPDGDGFGWENEKSCIVKKTSGKYPPCANPASDPDGDGYGWENNKTCLVVK